MSASGILVAALFAAPVGYLVVRNFQLGFDLFSLLTQSDVLKPLRNSLVLAILVSAGAATVGTAVSWLSVRTNVWGARLWRILLPLPLVIPSFIAASALLAAFARGGFIEEVFGWNPPNAYGLWGAAGVLILITYPFVSLPVSAHLRSLPSSLEESARLLGSSPWRVFRSIVLPQISTSILAGTLLVFLYVISDFGAVSILRYNTLTQAVYSSRLFEPAVSVALSLLLAAVAFLVISGERFAFSRRFQFERQHSDRHVPIPLKRWNWVATAGLSIVTFLSLIVPVVVLGWWSVRPAGASGVLSTLSDQLSELSRPALNTLVIGLVTAAVTVALTLPPALLTSRSRSRTSAFVNASVIGAFALPGIVIALALVFWSLKLPESFGLYQSFPLLVFAYSVHFGAQSMRVTQATVAGVPRRLVDAASLLGARGVRRWWTIELPLIIPGLLGAAGLVLLSTMKELPATLLLAPTGFETLATHIWNASEGLLLAQVGFGSLVLLALSGVCTWGLLRLSFGRGFEEDDSTFNRIL